MLAYAIGLAQRDQAELHLCRSMQIPLSIPAMAWSLKGDDFGAFLVKHGAAELEQLAQEVTGVSAVHRWCELGQPSDVICRLAREHEIDLVVIGSHGYDRVDRVLGTTAAKVTNHAPCSVLVVREP